MNDGVVNEWISLTYSVKGSHEIKQLDKKRSQQLNCGKNIYSLKHFEVKVCLHIYFPLQVTLCTYRLISLRKEICFIHFAKKQQQQQFLGPFRIT